MATAKKRTARPKTKSGKPRARKGVKLQPTELSADELALSLDALDDDVRALAEAVVADGGRVLASYREPLGGHVQLFAALPIDKVEPTPYQRDVSDAHVRKLTLAMDRTRRYLDPVIAVRVDRPMCEHYVGMFGFENFREVSVPGRAYFRIAVNLPEEFGRSV